MEFDWFWFTIVIGIICVSCFPHRAYKNQYNLNVITMEVKNGIIIDGVLHEAVQDNINAPHALYTRNAQRWTTQHV